MTATETAATTDTWTAQLEQLRVRYKHVRPPILAALNILIHDANIGIEDAKAQAALHGVKITAASVNAARTLLSRMDDKPAVATPPANGAATVRVRAPRTRRSAGVPFDAEAMVRTVITKLQGQSNADIERVRDGIRRAITILQGLVDA